MNIDYDALEKMLCERLCANAHINRRPDGMIVLETPFTFPDGDHYPIYLSETGTGGLRMSDEGHTLMHLSYEHDVDLLFEGTRGLWRERILNETNLLEGDGSFFMDVSLDGLADAVFRFGQGLTRVYDLSSMSRSRVASLFYDDLRKILFDIVEEEKVAIDYLPGGVPEGENYPVDYRIEGKADVPVFLYGIPSRDKARLTTIMLSHFLRYKLSFESVLVFENQQEIPRRDLARLSNVGGEMVSSLEAKSDLERKVLKLVASNHS